MKMESICRISYTINIRHWIDYILDRFNWLIAFFILDSNVIIRIQCLYLFIHKFICDKFKCFNYMFLWCLYVEITSWLNTLVLYRDFFQLNHPSLSVHINCMKKESIQYKSGQTLNLCELDLINCIYCNYIDLASNQFNEINVASW